METCTLQRIERKGSLHLQSSRENDIRRRETLFLFFLPKKEGIEEEGVQKSFANSSKTTRKGEGGKLSLVDGEQNGKQPLALTLEANGKEKKKKLFSFFVAQLRQTVW